MSTHEPVNTGEIPLDLEWFRGIEVPNDPGRKVNDLMDWEIEKAIGLFEKSNPQYVAALRLEKQRRDAEFDAERLPAVENFDDDFDAEEAETHLIACGWTFTQAEDGTWHGEAAQSNLKTMRGYFISKEAALNAANNLQWALDANMIGSGCQVKPSVPISPALDQEMIADTAPALVQIESALAPVVQLDLFDYGELNDDSRSIVQQCAQEIRARVGSIQRMTVQIGQRLREAKTHLDRGQWGKWLDSETGISRDTADRLIQVADAVEAMPQLAANLSAIDRSAVYLLVAPSTPEAALVEATARAEAGEKITPTKAKEIVERHKPAKAAKEHERGVCRKCGCREGNRCVAVEGGEICTWAAGEHKTLCNFCRDKRQAQRDQAEAVEPAVVKERDILPAESQIEKADQLEKLTNAVALAKSIRESIESDIDQQQRQQRDAWESSTIEISIKLHKADGNESGRLMQVAIGANGELPKMIFPRFLDLYDSGYQDAVKFASLFPPVIANAISALAEQLPTRLAQAEARRKAEEERAAAEKAKAAKPSPQAKQSAKTAAKKSVAKPAAKPAITKNKKAAAK